MNLVILNLKENMKRLECQIEEQKSCIKRSYSNIKSTEEYLDRLKRDQLELHSALKVLENSEELLGNVDIPQTSAPKL